MKAIHLMAWASTGLALLLASTSVTQSSREMAGFYDRDKSGTLTATQKRKAPQVPFSPELAEPVSLEAERGGFSAQWIWTNSFSSQGLITTGITSISQLKKNVAKRHSLEQQRHKTATKFFRRG